MSLRRVKLPFTGFYDNDMFMSGINAQIEDLKDSGMSIESIQEELDNVDYSSLYKRVTDNYVDLLADDINDLLSTQFKFYEPDYTGNVGNQSVDKLTAVIRLNELPNIGELHNFLVNRDIMDFKSALVSIAHSMTGSDDADKMRELIKTNADYSLWDNNSLEYLLITLQQAVAINLDLVNEGDDWIIAIFSYEEARLLEDCICNGLLTADNLYPPED